MRRGRAGSGLDPLEHDATNAWLAARGEDGAFEFERLNEDDDWAALVPVVEASGADPRVALPRLAMFAAEIIKWNRTVSNLVSLADESRLVSRHIKESLEPASWLAQTGLKRWIDFGSGAGFPGLPLALCGIGSEWMLVESRRPKTLFLRRVIETLELRSVHVSHSRLEDLILELEQSEPDRDTPVLYDGFTSRATLPMAPTLELAARTIRPGGAVFLWKGSRGAKELASSDRAIWTVDGEKALENGEVEVFKLLLNK